MDSPSLVQKPDAVSLAVKLFWATLAVGLVKVLADFAALSASGPAAAVNFVLIFTFGLIAFLIFKISAGRNWARITMLVFFVIGALPSVPLILGEFSRSAVIGVLSVAQLGLQGYALFLVFTRPGSSWFRKGRQSEGLLPPKTEGEPL